MNETDRYVAEIMRRIHAPAARRERIEADLRAHLQAAADAGEPPRAAMSRLGAPQEVATEFMSQVPLRYAGFWPRLVAFGIDLAAIMMLSGLFAFAAVALASFVPQRPEGWQWVAGAALIGLAAASALACLGVILLYFPILEGRFGQTAGKRLLGLVVLREDGLAIGYKEALLRRLPYYLEILPFDALFIPFTARRQRAFDIVARTVVVHAE